MAKFMGIVLQKMTQITHNLIGQSVQISQNILDITEKNPYWASVVRASEAVRFLDLLIWS